MIVNGLEINMRQKEHEKLRKHQNQLLTMLDELDNYCKRENFQYILGYAGLIGIKLFDGFLPWDDDIDLLMPRVDYNKLKEKVGTYIDKEKTLLVVDSSIDKNNNLNFIKIIKINSRSYEHEIDEILGRTSGAFIDITPIDNIPENIIIRKLVFMPLYLLFSLNYIKTKLLIKTKSVKTRKLIKKLSPSYKLLNRASDSYQKIINQLFRGSKIVGQISDCVDLQNSVFSRSSIYPFSIELFEGRYVSVPNNIDEFLTMRYGNWGIPDLKFRKPPHSK